MKLALPLFGTRISPRFDCAQELLIITVEKGKVTKKEKILWRGLYPHARIAELTNMAINIVICGAIDGFSHNLLAHKGIRIYEWVTGDAEKAVELFINGKLQPGMILMPGGRRGLWRCRVRSGWKRQLFPPNNGKNNLL